MLSSCWAGNSAGPSSSVPGRYQLAGPYQRTHKLDVAVILILIKRAGQLTRLSSSAGVRLFRRNVGELRDSANGIIVQFIFRRQRVKLHMIEARAIKCHAVANIAQCSSPPAPAHAMRLPGDIGKVLENLRAVISGWVISLVIRNLTDVRKSDMCFGI